MKKEVIIGHLKDQKSEAEVENFASYCVRLKFEKDRTGKIKNAWFQRKTESDVAELFKRVANDGLVFDGKHITFQSTGISFDYVAYTNKMLLSHPETKFDVNVVYKDDVYAFEKHSGKVTYNHVFIKPFEQTEANIIGGYVVIKNNKGDFLTTLTRDEIDKHRKVAKTDYIWKAWFKEMVMKTLIKKAVKYHFEDMYKVIEEIDNQNYDLEKDTSKSEIEVLSSELIDALVLYQGDDKDTIISMCAEKKQKGEVTIAFLTETLKSVS